VKFVFGRGGQRFVTVCDREGGGGSKIANFSVTYFMDGPKPDVSIMQLSQKTCYENCELANNTNRKIIASKIVKTKKLSA